MSTTYLKIDFRTHPAMESSTYPEMGSRTESSGGSSRPSTRPHIQVVVDNYDDNDIVQHRCVILTGKCVPIPLNQKKIRVTCLGANREILQRQETRELSDAGVFNIPLLLSYGRNDITLTPCNTSANFPFCLIYLPPDDVPVIQLVALIASDSLHRPVNKKKNAKAEKKLDPPPWGLKECTDQLRTTAYMYQAFIAEEMIRHKWGRRTFNMKENWLEREMINIQPQVRLIYTDKTVAEIQAAELDRNNGVQFHKDGWVQILSEELLNIDEYKIPGTVVLGIVMDALGPSGDNIVRDISSGFRTTPNGLSLAVCGGMQTHRLPTQLSEFEKITHDEDESYGYFTQQDGTSMPIDDLEAASISQLSILNSLLLALGVPNPFHSVTPTSALSWAYRFRAPNTTPFQWHTVDIESLTPNRYMTSPPQTDWTPTQPTYRIIYRDSQYPHPKVTIDDYPFLLIESTSRIIHIRIQGKDIPYSASRSPDWEPEYFYILPAWECRYKYKYGWEETMCMIIEVADGSVVEIPDVWELEGGWVPGTFETRDSEREEARLLEISRRQHV